MLLSSIWAGSRKEAVWSERVICIDMSRDGLVLAVGARAAGWENTKYYRILLNIAVIMSSGRAGHNVKQGYHVPWEERFPSQ